MHCFSYYMPCFRHYMRFFCDDMQCFRRYMRWVLHDEVTIPRGLGRSFWKYGHSYCGFAILFPFLLSSCSLGDMEMDTVLKRVKLEDLTQKFQTEHITLDIDCKLSVHEMEMLGINSCSVMMSLRLECTKFGGRSTKQTQGNVWCPHFLYSTVCAWWFATRGNYNEGNSFDPCCIREYGLPEDEVIRIEQVRVYWH